jgi:glutamyl-tRNA reductase
VRLRLIHQSPGASPVPSGAVLWRTCLREVVFLTEGTDTDEPDSAHAPVVTDADAYTLLLEIVCGLRSPLVGETEVQAQFKAFLVSLDRRRDGPLRRLGQRVLADAKGIRERHLQGFGAHSYGPLVARHIPEGRRIILVGTGALAAEVAGSLTRHRIDRWGRRAADDRHVDYLLSEARDRPVESADPATLVIAAPASQFDLVAVAACYSQVREIIDLRASDERSAFAVKDDARVTTLDDLFVEARSLGTTPISRLSAARRDISRLGQAYGRRVEVHPFGWDDVCA